MEKNKSVQSWKISDEFWEEIKDYIPKKQRDPNKHYQRAPGQGRPSLPARQVLEGIFYVLRTGCQWKAVPREYGCGSSINRYFHEWQEAGLFEKIWELGLKKDDELEEEKWKRKLNRK